MTMDIFKNKIKRNLPKSYFLYQFYLKCLLKTVSVRNSFWDNMIINKDTDTNCYFTSYDYAKQNRCLK